MRRIIRQILAIAVLCATGRAQNVITTFAGADFIFDGNGKPAKSVHFKQPSAITIDPNGNPVVVDSFFGVVARLNFDGTLTVLAGNGFSLGDSGDNGPATTAGLSNPVSAAFDRQGNLYIGEPGHIRKVTPGGIITTIAGTRRLDPGFSGDGGPAVDAQIYSSGGLAVDADGNIFLGDGNNHRIRKIDTRGIITTVAGNGVPASSGDGGLAINASLYNPSSVAIGLEGDLYIADPNYNCIRRVNPAGLISSVLLCTANGGIAPASLAFDASGVLFIGGYYAVYKLLPGAPTPQLIAGSAGSFGFSGDNGPAIDALLKVNGVPIAVDAQGSVFLADTFNFRVRKVTNGIITTVAGSSFFALDGVPARDLPLVFTQYTAGYLSPTTGLVGGIAFDPLGNTYVSEPDNNRVLMISPEGVATTFAGTGVLGYTGDNGPATKANLHAPSGLAFLSGSLYIADSGNGVRRVGTDGIITTFSAGGSPNGLAFDKTGNLFATCTDGRVRRFDARGTATIIAGTGNYGGSGDGGVALRATFELPSGIAVDGAGNVYVADYWNSRVRVITPQGLIKAYAGTGVTERSAGDNGPALQALFGQVDGLLLDAAGNLYIAESYYGTAGRVRLVSPSGLITTFAGGGPPDQLGDGLPATQATLKAPTALALDSFSNLYVADAGSSRIRKVLANPPTVQVAPASVSFTAPSGGAPVSGTFLVTSAVTGLRFTVSINQGGAAWLSADVTTDATPRVVTLTADPADIPSGTYSAVVSIVPVGGVPPPGVTVSFEVGITQPAILRAHRSDISFTLPKGAPARSTTVLISNDGGQTLTYNAAPHVESGGNWLSVSPASGSATPGKPSTLTVVANPAALLPGVYSGGVSIVTGAGSQDIPVILTVSDNPQAVLLTQSGLSFTAVAKGGVIPPQAFGVVNAGTGVMNWTADVLTTSGGNWLQISPARGSSEAAAAAPQVTVSVNALGLAQGAYYGTVRVSAPGTANQSRVVTVFLNVLAAGTPHAASVQPPELVFYANGGLPPGSQTVNVYNISATPRSFTSGRSSEGFQLYPLPGNATLDPAQPTPVLIQPFGSFGSGTVKGTLTFQFSDGTTQSVAITVLSAAPAASPLAARSGPGFRDDTSCAPSQLVVRLNTLSKSFQVPAGWPVGLNVTVTDDCQAPLLSGAGSVWAHFDDGEDDVILTALQDGNWQGSWKPQQVNPNVTITMNARKGALSAQKVISGALVSPSVQPFFTLNSIGSAFPQPTAAVRPIAPGAFLAIYGTNLAESTLDAQGPFSPQLGDTQVFFNDRPGVLSHVDPGQVNVIVPYYVSVHTTIQIRIQRALTLSDPVAVDVADAQPSVLQDSGAANVVAYPANQSAPFQVSSSAPAGAGDVLVLYCLGLGKPDQPFNDGQISPSNPLALTPGVTVTIGGKDAPVQFAGLTPGSVGLYQINSVMPAGVPAGNAASLTITAGGQTSPAVTVPIH
jgi:uncharacterized protein (TIGR03437 family)